MKDWKYFPDLGSLDYLGFRIETKNARACTAEERKLKMLLFESLFWMIGHRRPTQAEALNLRKLQSLMRCFRTKIHHACSHIIGLNPKS
jgi:hypothetical protein